MTHSKINRLLRCQSALVMRLFHLFINRIAYNTRFIWCREKWKVFWKSSLEVNSKNYLSNKSPNVSLRPDLIWLISSMVYLTEKNKRKEKKKNKTEVYIRSNRIYLKLANIKLIILCALCFLPFFTFSCFIRF